MPTPVRRLFLLAGKQIAAASNPAERHERAWLAYEHIGSSDNERFLYPLHDLPTPTGVQRLLD
jgi:hypothetical protein